MIKELKIKNFTCDLYLMVKTVECSMLHCLENYVESWPEEISKIKNKLTMETTVYINEDI